MDSDKDLKTIEKIISYFVIISILAFLLVVVFPNNPFANFVQNINNKDGYSYFHDKLSSKVSWDYKIFEYNNGAIVYYYFDKGDTIGEWVNQYYSDEKYQEYSPLNEQEFTEILTLINNDMKQRYYNGNDYINIYTDNFLFYSKNDICFVPVVSPYFTPDPEYPDAHFMRFVKYNDNYYITEYYYDLEIEKLKTLESANSKSILTTSNWNGYHYIDIQNAVYSDFINKQLHKIDENFFNADLDVISESFLENRIEYINYSNLEFYDEINIKKNDVEKVIHSESTITKVDYHNLPQVLSTYYTTGKLVAGYDVELIRDLTSMLNSILLREINHQDMIAFTYPNDYVPGGISGNYANHLKDYMLTYQELTDLKSQTEDIITAILNNNFKSIEQIEILPYNTEYQLFLIDVLSQILEVSEITTKELIGIEVKHQEIIVNGFSTSRDIYSVPYKDDDRYFDIIFTTRSLDTESKRENCIISILQTMDYNDKYVLVNDDGLRKFKTATFTAYANQDDFADILIPYVDSLQNLKNFFNLNLIGCELTFTGYTNFTEIENMDELLQLEQITINDKTFYITKNERYIQEEDGSVDIQEYITKIQYIPEEYELYTIDIVTKYEGFYDAIIPRANIDRIHQVLYDIMETLEVDMTYKAIHRYNG